MLNTRAIATSLYKASGQWLASEIGLWSRNNQQSEKQPNTGEGAQRYTVALTAKWCRITRMLVAAPQRAGVGSAQMLLSSAMSLSFFSAGIRHCWRVGWPKI